MSHGRGSATLLILALFVVILAVQMDGVRSATYTVGGAGGWTFNVVGWPIGKRFKAGDVLVFNYGPSFHNVVEVGRAGYNGCRAPRGAKMHSTGKDRISLVRGQNHFICNFAGHCEAGMKIAVFAT